MARFTERKHIGEYYERVCANYLKSRGYFVQPIKEYLECVLGNSLRPIPETQRPILPDLHATGAKCAQMFVDVKFKHEPTFDLKMRCTVVGCDLKYLCDYRKVEQITQIPVFLFFPIETINLVVTGSLDHLRKCQTRQMGGVAYFDVYQLHRLMTLAEFRKYEP